MRWLCVVVLWVAAVVPVRAWATCSPVPPRMTLVLPSCGAAPAGKGPGDTVWPAELPLTFTYAGGTMCCAGSAESCSTKLVSVSPADLRFELLAVLEAPTEDGTSRGLREAGITCGGVPLLELTGGPLKAGKIELSARGAGTVTVKRGALSSAAIKRERALLAAATPGATSEHEPPPEPISVSAALRSVEVHPAMASGEETLADVSVAKGAPGLPAKESGLWPLLLVQGRVRYPAEPKRPAELRLFVVDRRDGAVYHKQPAEFARLAAGAGLYDKKRKHKAKEWLTLYLWLAGELPERYVERPARYIKNGDTPPDIRPTSYELRSDHYVVLFGCFVVAGQDRTRCGELQAVEGQPSAMVE